MNRTKRGYLLINEKKRFVYNGLNMIGRNRGATVILADTSVSHYQSAVVVINGEHYLSDINSSNGTFLKQLKLLPLQLYKINNGDFIRFGLVNAIYFKLADDTDVSIETDDELSIIGEDVFNANTQAYNFTSDNAKNSILNLKDAVMLRNHPEEMLVQSVIVPINDLPTQLVGDNNDTEAEVQDSVTISINDLPTQLIGDKNDYVTSAINVENEVEKQLDFGDNEGTTSTTYSLINDLPTQVISNEKDGVHVSDEEDVTLNQLPDDIVDETALADDIRQTESDPVAPYDQNSRESTDFLTMQPAATQACASESQSQLRENVQLLQRRIRNVISSDEESEDDEGRNRKNVTATAAVHCSSSGEETDVEITVRKTTLTETGMGKKKKKKKKNSKAIIECSDSETHIEPRQRSGVEFDDKASSSRDSSDVTDVEGDGVTKMVRTGEDSLNDSDMIPATQDHPPMTNTRSQIGMGLRLPVGLVPNHVQDANFEASLTDSFQLILTNSPSSAEEEDEPEEPKNDTAITDLSAREADRADFIAADPKTRESKATDKIETGDAAKKSSRPTSEDEIQLPPVLERTSDIDTPGVSTQESHSQLEVDFGRENVRLEDVRVTERPANPLLNVFENELTEESTSYTDDTPRIHHAAYDAVEKKLSRLFESPGRVGGVAAEAAIGDVLMDNTQAIIESDAEARPAERSVTDSRRSHVFSEPKRSDKSTEGRRVDDDAVFLLPAQILEVDPPPKEKEDHASDKGDTPSSDQGPPFSKRNVEKDNDCENGAVISPSTHISRAERPNFECCEEAKREQISNKQYFEGTGTPITKSRVSSPKPNDCDDAIFLQPTQILGVDLPNSESVDGKKNQISSKCNRDESVDTSLKKSRVPPCKENSVNVDDGGIFGDSIEKEQKDPKKGKVFTKNKKYDGNIVTPASNDDDDGLFLQPTQILNTECRDVTPGESALREVKETVITCESNVEEITNGEDDDDDDDALFQQPTQIIIENVKPVSTEQEASKTISNLEEKDIVKGASAAFPDRLENVKKRNTDYDALFLQPTQILVANVTEQDESKEDVVSGKRRDDGVARRNEKRDRRESRKAVAVADIGLSENKSVKRKTEKKKVAENTTETGNEERRAGAVAIGVEQPRTRNDERSRRDGASPAVPETRRTSKRSQDKVTKSRETAKRHKLRGEMDVGGAEEEEEEEMAADLRMVNVAKAGRTLRRSKRKHSTDQPSAQSPAAETSYDKVVAEENLYVFKMVSDCPGDDENANASGARTRRGGGTVERGKTASGRRGENSEDEFEDKKVSPPKRARRETKTETPIRENRRRAAAAATSTVSGATGKGKSPTENGGSDASLQNKRRGGGGEAVKGIELRVAAVSERERPSRSSKEELGRGKKTTAKIADVSDDIAPSAERGGRGASAGGRAVNRTRRSGHPAAATSQDDFPAESDGGGKRLRQGRQKSVAIEPQSTPERNKRKLKPKVVFTMLDDPELETIIRSLGGFVVDSVEASTVLVTGSVKRSQKLLSAVGCAKPICSPEWLHESKKANAFLDPWDYILEDPEAESKWNFSLRESLRRSGDRRLLESYTFQMVVSAAQDVLKGAIEACGGKCVSRAPARAVPSGNFVIVSSPENKSKYVRFLKQKPMPTIVSAEAIFDGVLRQELRFQDHLLS